MAIVRSNSIFDSSISIDDGTEPINIKEKRIKQELKNACATYYGLLKFNSRFLPKVIHSNEHIIGVIYGRFAEGPGLLSLTDRMVVATDRRLIALNHKPGYTDLIEFTYDVVDGVEHSQAGPFAAVKINTKTGPYNLRFVRKACAEKFVHYLEKRRIEYFSNLSTRN